MPRRRVATTLCRRCAELCPPPTAPPPSCPRRWRRGTSTAPSAQPFRWHAAATRSILVAIRESTPEEACADTASRLLKGKANAGAVWDAVHLAAAELRMRARGAASLTSIHAVTSANALHYAFLSAPDPQA